MIVIAHRISTIRRADKIVVIDRRADRGNRHARGTDSPRRHLPSPARIAVSGCRRREWRFERDGVFGRSRVSPGSMTRVPRDIPSGLRGGMRRIRGLAADHLTESRRARPAEDELALCHSFDYIRTARRDVSAACRREHGRHRYLSRSFDAAVRAAGLCLDAVDLVVSGAAKNAFCIVARPDIATPSRGMASACSTISPLRRGMRSAATASSGPPSWIGRSSWQRHAGDFLQRSIRLFLQYAPVALVSGHWRRGGNGHGAGRGSTLDCPFPAGAGRDQILGAFRDKWAPCMDKFGPPTSHFPPASIRGSATRGSFSADGQGFPRT